MTLRRARRADVAALVALERRAFRTDRLTRRKILRLLAGRTSALLVAVDGNALVGYALTLFRRGARAARLYGIAVTSAARGRGVGRALLAAAERGARRRGCRAMRLEVRAGNPAARRLYCAAGYVRVARLADYYEDGAPAVRLAKSLGRVRST